MVSLKKRIAFNVFKTTLIVFFSFTQVAYAQSTTSMYVGENRFITCPNPPQGNAAIFQCAWGSSHQAISVSPTGYANSGCNVSVNEYFTGIAQVRCDYYWYWYVGSVQHTNHATTYYNITCLPVNLTLNHSNLSLRVGQSQYLTYSANPSTAPSPTVTWTSSDYNIIAVNGSGRVEALSPGSAIVTANNSSGPNATCHITVTSNTPTSLTLSMHQIMLDPGQSYLLNHSVIPTGVPYTLHWESSNTSVATIYAGTVYGEGSGSARITASIPGTNLVDTCHVTVRNLNPTSISIPHTKTIICGQSSTISPTVIPANANYSINWSSSNNSVVMVSNGTIRGLTEGNAIITAQIVGTSLYDTCLVEVIPNQPTSIILPHTCNLNVGQNTILTPNIQPQGVDYTLDWESDNESVVSVDNGTIYGINEGTATITSRVVGLLLADTCRVSVIRPTLTLSSSVPEGWVQSETVVELTASDSTASIYYTIDGSVPSNNSILYAGPITICNNTTLRAIAYHPYYYQSAELRLEYRVSSLRIADLFPQNNSIHSYRPIPSVSFNKRILQNMNYDSIKLCNAQGTDLLRELIISNNTLFIIPENDIDTGLHTLFIPSGAVKSTEGEPNIAINITYYFRRTPCNPTVKADYLSFLTNDGALYRWGSTNHTYPSPTPANSVTPSLVMTDVKDFYLINISQNYVIKSDNSLWAWGGSTAYAPLGDGYLTSRVTPVFIADSVVKVMSEGNHGMFHAVGLLKSSGALLTWGSFDSWSYALLGRPATGVHYTPTEILTNVRDFIIHGWFGVALTNDSLLYVWGRKENIGRNVNQSIPILKTPYKIVEIAAGLNHVLALRDNGQVLAFGENDQYQLGVTNTNTTTNTYTPIADVRHIVASGGVNAAIKNDNTLWVWGTYYYGYADPLTISQTPQMKLDSVEQVYIATDAVYALREDGSLWGMGYSGPTPMTTMSKIMDDVVSCWIGDDATRCRYAIKEDNSFWGWGINMPYDHYSSYRAPFIILDGCSSVQSISFDSIAMRDTIGIGSKLVLQPHLYPIDGSYDSIYWMSTDSMIATVSQSGVVHALNNGCVDIQCAIMVDDTVMQATAHVVCATVDTVTACDSCLWHGKTYTSSCTDTYISTTNNEECDSVVILNLTINNSVYSKEFIEAEGNFLWHDSNYTESGTYYWYGTTETGCDIMDTLMLIINPIDINLNNVDMPDIAVSPNPTSGVITIDANDVLRVDILDMVGHKATTIERQRTIDIGTLPKGIYILKIHLQRGIFLKQVLLI